MPTLVHDFELAGGRQLPRLLFVTDVERLKAAVDDAQGVTDLIARITAPHEVLNIDTAGLGALDVVQRVRNELNAHGPYEGVVLVGGYDVLPSVCVDCIPPGSTTTPDKDVDNFRVWCDDLYGDRDGDGAPELPVSRVPDGHDLDFLCKVLSVPDSPARVQGRSVAAYARDGGAYGLCSAFVAFPKVVFRSFTSVAMERSRPFNPGVDKLPGSRDPIYLVLHGKRDDNAILYGRVKPHVSVEAIRLADLPGALAGSTVLAGSCWGALIVDETADSYSANVPLTARTPQNSVALRALENGACAWIGHTGLQYTPEDGTGQPSTDDNMARPMHALILAEYLRGAAPARALFNAKATYAGDIPHDVLDSDWHIAAECKTFLQTTCLGLGW